MRRWARDQSSVGSFRFTVKRGSREISLRGGVNFTPRSVSPDAGHLVQMIRSHRARKGPPAINRLQPKDINVLPGNGMGVIPWVV